MRAQGTQPDPADIPGYMTSLSNWGRWGDDDELGTLNLITPGRIAVAAGLVVGWPDGVMWVAGRSGRAGRIRPAAADVPDGRRGTAAGAAGAVPRPRRSVVEYVGLAFHGLTVTHLDAPSHVSWDGKIYNGRSAETVRHDLGACACAVTAAWQGITTRGVLLDVPAAHGTGRLEPGYAVQPADIAACERRQNVTVRPGDAVLLYTGASLQAHQAGHPAGLPPERMAGWGFSCLPWLRERDVAVAGCDGVNDVVPSGGGGFGFDLPLHLVGLVAMGLWLLDNCDLAGLAAACASLGRWEFMFSVLPLRLAGATGSPVNPVAVL